MIPNPPSSQNWEEKKPLVAIIHKAIWLFFKKKSFLKKVKTHCFSFFHLWISFCQWIKIHQEKRIVFSSTHSLINWKSNSVVDQPYRAKVSIWIVSTKQIIQHLPISAGWYTRSIATTQRKLMQWSAAFTLRANMSSSLVFEHFLTAVKIRAMVYGNQDGLLVVFFP